MKAKTRFSYQNISRATICNTFVDLFQLQKRRFGGL